MTTDPDEAARETAWRIHAALADWTARADAKASFVLTVESAALIGIGALFNLNGQLRDIVGVFPNVLLWTGVALLTAAALLAASAVSPRTRRKKVQSEWQDNFIYFGHLRHWEAQELAEALRTRDPLPVLTRQLTAMSQIAWTKYERVERSLVLAVAGAMAVSLAGLIG
jgi:Family of unknown function (DUF5706)